MTAEDFIQEKDFQATVVETAKLTGWLVYHTYDSRRSERGFPDLVLVRDHELLFVEIKLDKKNPTKPQREWLKALDRVADTCVWRPKDWPEIERRLS